MSPVQRIATHRGETEEPYSHPAFYRLSNIRSGVPRIIATVPSGRAALVESLTGALEEPIHLLYVLHTPRGEGTAGRYQATYKTRDDVAQFLERFATFFQADSRFDLWLHSPLNQATLVWDRHNLLFLYGPVAEWERRLLEEGFCPGDPNMDFPHVHYYRAEFDNEARELLKYFDWEFSDLHPEDIQ